MLRNEFLKCRKEKSLKLWPVFDHRNDGKKKIKSRFSCRQIPRTDARLYREKKRCIRSWLCNKL